MFAVAVQAQEVPAVTAAPSQPAPTVSQSEEMSVPATATATAVPATESASAGEPVAAEPVSGAVAGPMLFPIGIELWMTPRDATTILHEPGISQAVKRLLDEPEAYLEVRYPTGEMGELWGQELQAWLVALGVVSDRIELLQSSEPAEGIVLAVVGASGAAVETEKAPAADVLEGSADVKHEPEATPADSTPVVTEPEVPAVGAEPPAAVDASVP